MESADIAPAAFSAPAADLQALLNGPVRVHLAELGVIAVRGADAATFLQTQLTNDVVGQGQDTLLLSGYCTPKGRLLATFHQWREGDEVRLALPREILVPVMKRLSMFVLRSKLVLADLSDSCSISALLGPGSASLLRAAGFDPPAAAWESRKTSGVRISRLPGSGASDERFVLAMDPGEQWPASLAGARAVASGVWWWSEVAAAVPTVFKRTQEKFVPQMINYEVLGGVNFKKGCYPGQEIVARSQYIGKLKRRMHLAHSQRDHQLAPGADIFIAGEDAPIGTVVMAAAAPAGGVDLLFEAPSDRIVGASLCAGSANGATLELRPLPYQLFDPTA
jgi:hypothetical protein